MYFARNSNLISGFLLSCIICTGASLSSPAVPASVAPTVTYFDARGRAEVTRCIFKIAEKEFEDERFPITLKLGADGTPTGFEVLEFEKQKKEGKFKVNMDRLPTMKIDGITIGQSPAMERAAATVCGMTGKGFAEQCLIDCLCENVRDLKDSWRDLTIKQGFKPSPEKTKAKEEWFNKPVSERGGFRQLISSLNNSLPSLAAGAADHFAVGDSITLLDVLIWNLLKETFTEQDDFELFDAAMTGNNDMSVDRLNAIADHIHSLPMIQEWLEKRPLTKM
mmetsp:Transcript_11335/g.14933  ORF Transcript_11335/g.14933 Transcript_11335/m.14933 type:complete len:279 (+) Transcript_11335:91-927(+)